MYCNICFLIRMHSFISFLKYFEKFNTICQFNKTILILIKIYCICTVFIVIIFIKKNCFIKRKKSEKNNERYLRTDSTLLTCNVPSYCLLIFPSFSTHYAIWFIDDHAYLAECLTVRKFLNRSVNTIKRGFRSMPTKWTASIH